MNKKLIAVVAASLIGYTGYFEGERLIGYFDPTGTPTYCYGSTKGAIVGKRYTLDECKRYLSRDLTEAAEAVARNVKIELPFNTYRALTDFTFNVGEGNLRKSTLLKKLNNGDIEGACNEMPKWVYSKGVKLNGLVKRREANRELCLSGL
jgi:lysozyme